MNTLHVDFKAMQTQYTREASNHRNTREDLQKLTASEGTLQDRFTADTNVGFKPHPSRNISVASPVSSRSPSPRPPTPSLPSQPVKPPAASGGSATAGTQGTADSGVLDALRKLS